MELTLSRQDATTTQVSVACDGQHSHTFDLLSLIPASSGDDEQGLPGPFDDAVAYGTALFAALFQPGSVAASKLQEEYGKERPRILLVTADEMVDAIPWEYAYGSDGEFLVCEMPFVRGLPREQRIPPPERVGGLHIVAVPSNPLDEGLAPLNILGEWTRLKEIVGQLEAAVTLDRAWPPTIEKLRERVAGQRQRVVHFMGHGGQFQQVGAVLCFEKDNGSLETVTAREFTKRLSGSVFLVTLNACQSATPGETHFSNLASALAQARIPYALGMRFSIVDNDALAFSRAFYGELSRGVPIEESLYQARLSLVKSKRQWAIGVPVLYTSLDLPPEADAPGFHTEPGTPVVSDPQEPALRGILGILPQIEGAFQGRVAELIQLGNWLTGDDRPRLVTIHGSGGQGKTTLARETVERFAYAWPGGAHVVTLENLPARSVFANTLARSLCIDPQSVPDSSELERQVLQRLVQRRTLVVLDNAETLDVAVKKNEAETLDVAAQKSKAEALQLADFIKQLPASTVSLLVTSRHLLGWAGEQSLELEGLGPDAGAALFLQSAPGRLPTLDLERAWELARQLSIRVDGHPFGLFLLGKAFDSSPVSLETFIADYESWLLTAENKYSKEPDHRQRTINSIFDYSARDLDKNLKSLLSKLWIFHAPFQPAAAVAIFDPEHDSKSGTRSPDEDGLHALWQRGLLNREETGSDDLLLYSIQPVMRTYIEHYLANPGERESLLARFGSAYAIFAQNLYNRLDRGALAAFLATLCRADLERGMSYVTGSELANYQLCWGWVSQRLGFRLQGLALTEQALEYAQGQDSRLMLQAMNNLAIMYQQTGRVYQALRLNEQALPIRREVGDRAGEATTLNNLGGVYDALGQKARALEYYQQALPITREVGDRAGEGVTLHNIGTIYMHFGQFSIALACFLLAKALFEYVRNPSYIDVAMRWMKNLQQRLGEEQFDELYRQVAGREEEILRKALQEGLPPDADLQGSQGGNASTMPAERVAIIVNNTVAVMTVVPERREEWRETIQQNLEHAQQRGEDWRIEVEFFMVILALLDGLAAELPGEHPYVSALERIKQGIANGGPQAAGDSEDDEGDEEDVPEEVRALLSLAETSIAALRGGQQERMALLQQLIPLQAQVQDIGMKALLQNIQLALSGRDLTQLGGDLDGLYKQVWDVIVAGVTGGDGEGDSL
jgi:tetratricopeptide (TPR) repeat protein